MYNTCISSVYCLPHSLLTLNLSLTNMHMKTAIQPKKCIWCGRDLIATWYIEYDDGDPYLIHTEDCPGCDERQSAVRKQAREQDAEAGVPAIKFPKWNPPEHLKDVPLASSNARKM